MIPDNCTRRKSNVLKQNKFKLSTGIHLLFIATSSSRQVLSISVPDEALPGEEVVAEAASGEHVVFTLPKGVAPGTRLQMVPTRQVMQRGHSHDFIEIII